MSRLQFGTNGEVSFDAKTRIDPNESIVPIGEPLQNIADSVRRSLKNPLDFPSLDRIVLPDDTVVIALQPGLPCAAELLAGTVQGVLEAGVPAELIRILRAPYDRAISAKQLLGSLDAGIADRLTVLEHDPAEREQLSFLGASKNDNAVYVSREMCDAGIVIPIGFQGSGSGIHCSWYPAFSNLETQARFNKAMSSNKKKKIAKQLAECDEVGWMSGIQFVVQLVPAGNDQAMHVLSGQPQAVWDKATELFESAWRVPVKQPANLVVAGIGGGPEQQTWENITRTIDRLLDAVEVDGAIAICSQLKSKPGPALRRLASCEDFESAENAIREMPTPDAMAASLLNRALQRVRVYLLSELGESDVEDLGVAFVANAKEISKLSSQFESCLAFENAQHISISRETN